MIPGFATGALFGLGVVTIWSAYWPREARRAGRSGSRTRFEQRIRDDFARIGLASARPLHLLLASVVLAGLVFLLTLGISTAMIPSAAAGAGAFFLPAWALRTLARRRQENLREVWPEVIDLVGSAVRAGLSLPESLAQLAERGPEQLRSPFGEFAREYHATGDFSYSLDRLKERLSDPVADRIIEALRITRDVGGTDLGTLLRTLSSFLREDARVRSELEARQSWTVNGAKLALIAPWVVLGLMILRPEAAEAYDTAAGGMLIIVGAAVSFFAYRLMLTFARLPQDERVLRE
ncbi:type II secretion system F family protein [Dermabacter vaginalis]|uniref:type II secretion system F family protein n=1 Tax=Dermabacter vaginalis TaxID=1630135 RepID=UPI0021A953E9|nr:type II secretion system F family protein [Dermabacter vaginalis]MCT2149515.1 type II secretion system F family protein [Dermabacter vaginalis]